MCTYSMIARDWMNPYSPNYTPVPGWPSVDPYQPKPIPMPAAPPQPNYILPPNPIPSVTPDIAQRMLEILKKVDELDKKLGRLDCKLDEAEKKQYVKALRKVAGKKCPCKTKKAKKAKKATPQLLTETADQKIDGKSVATRMNSSIGSGQYGK